MRNYFKIFWVMSLTFGIAMGIWTALTDGPLQGLIAGVAQGVFFGFFMSLLMGTMHNRKVKQLGAPKDVTPHYSRTVTLKQPLAKAFMTCVDALETLKIESIQEAEDKSTIVAKLRSSWDSFGEKITITLSAKEGGSTELVIANAPRMPLTVLDLGKGYQNVTGYIAALTERGEVTEGADR